jgi:hypothetical protein
MKRKAKDSGTKLPPTPTSTPRTSAGGQITVTNVHKDIMQSKHDLSISLWTETQDYSRELIAIRNRVMELGQKATTNYKQIASILNEGIPANEFIADCDFTRDTLYYSFDPLYNYSCIFFVDIKNDGNFTAFQVYYVPEDTEKRIKESLEIQFNPYYALKSLQNMHMSITDVATPFNMLPDEIKDENLERLAELFDNPAPALEPGNFMNAIQEKLYIITKDSRFRSEVKPENPQSVIDQIVKDETSLH